MPHRKSPLTVLIDQRNRAPAPRRRLQPTEATHSLFPGAPSDPGLPSVSSFAPTYSTGWNPVFTVFKAMFKINSDLKVPLSNLHNTFLRILERGGEKYKTLTEIGNAFSEPGCFLEVGFFRPPAAPGTC